MVMKALRQGASGGILKFIIFGFLLFAMGGMVFMDVGGFFRNGGVSGNDVAKAGRSSISLQAFDRDARRQLAQIGITSADAYKAGYLDQILNAEIRGLLMQQAADDLGIEVGRQNIAKQIQTLIAPMIKGNEDPKNVLKQILMNQGMSEGELTRAMARETTLALLDHTIRAGFAQVPDTMSADLYAFQNETRNISYISFLDSDVKDTLSPDEKQLQQIYEATKENYSTPETRVLQIVKLNGDSLKKSIQIDDKEIEESYNNNIDLYSEKEQKSLETALVETKENAQAIADKAKTAKDLREAVKETTKRDSDYLGERDFTIDKVPQEFRDQIKTAKTGDVIGPVKTNIGWQVMRVGKITPATTKPLAEVRNEIRDELLDNKISDQMFQLSGQVEDMLAAGSSLDDVKKEIAIDVTTLPEINSAGQGKDGKDALKDFDKMRKTILDNGFKLEKDETSPMSETQDGGYMAIHVQSVTPKVYKSFEEIKGEMTQKWVEDQRRVANKIQVMNTVKEISEKKQSAGDFARAQNKILQARSGMSRSDKPSAPFDFRSIQTVFEANPNEAFIIDIQGGAAIAWVTDVNMPQKVDTSSKAYKDFDKSVLAATQNEAVLMYGENKRVKYGARINKHLLDQTYGKNNSEY